MLFGISNRCILFNCSWVIFVQFLVAFCIVCVAVFILGIWVLIAILIGSYCVDLSLLISESICVLSSHVLPKMSSNPSSTFFFAYLFLVFGINAWSESAVFFILWFFLFFSLSSYLCVRSTQIPFTNSIVFPLVYHSVFISRFTESSVLHHSVLADFVYEN